jgi:selenophosphate synthase
MFRYTIPLGEIEDELRKNGKHIYPTGNLACAIKLSLDSVYFALMELKESTSIRFNLDDAYAMESENGVEVIRSLYTKQRGFGELQEDISRYNPEAMIALMSLGQDYKQVMGDFYKQAGKAKSGMVLGKAHTIDASNLGTEFVMVDWLQYKRGDGGKYLVLNNDTMSVVDPSTPPYSWISLISWNNSLNDIFSKGVHKNIRLYPVFDSKDAAEFDVFFEKAEDILGKHLGGLEIVDRNRLGLGADLVGATVSGETYKEVPGRTLEVGQKLIITKTMGSSAFLTHYKKKVENGEWSKGLEEKRIRVLQGMLEPNVEAARTISKYLPEKGRKLDPNEHIMFTTDISGPGIGGVIGPVLEESSVGVYIDELPLVGELDEAYLGEPEDKKTLLFPDTLTTDANGPILIAAHPKVAEEFLADLRGQGYNSSIIGEVIPQEDGKPRWQYSEHVREKHERGKRFKHMHT